MGPRHPWLDPGRLGHGERSARERGLLDTGGELTEDGVALRKEIEAATDRLDLAPYEHLGAAGVERLTELATDVVTTLLGAGAFPAGMVGKG